MPCQVSRRSSFKRALRKLDSSERRRVEKALSDLSKEPFLGKLLKGRLKRLRSYR